MNDVRVTFPKPCDQSWDDMAAAGCNRHCAKCDKVIHDLDQLTVDEAERLLDSGREICVRAQLDAGGAVRLKSKGTRRLIAASASLMTFGPQAAAADNRPAGIISGKVTGCPAQISAVAADGRTYIAKVKINGSYKFKHLPDGRYEISIPGGGGRPLGNVVVQNGAKVRFNADDSQNCIIIGMIERADPKA